MAEQAPGRREDQGKAPDGSAALANFRFLRLPRMAAGKNRRTIRGFRGSGLSNQASRNRGAASRGGSVGEGNDVDYAGGVEALRSDERATTNPMATPLRRVRAIPRC